MGVRRPSGSRAGERADLRATPPTRSYDPTYAPAGAGAEVQGFVEATVGDEVTIRRLHVHPEARGQGLGAALVERVRDRERPLAARVLSSARCARGTSTEERFPPLPTGSALEVPLAGFDGFPVDLPGYYRVGGPRRWTRADITTPRDRPPGRTPGRDPVRRPSSHAPRRTRGRKPPLETRVARLACRTGAPAGNHGVRTHTVVLDSLRQVTSSGTSR